MPAHIVTVTIYETQDGPYVDTEPIHMNKAKNKQVEWVHSDGEDFTVVFTAATGSPFNGANFDQGNSNSGRVRNNAIPQYYKYTLTTASGSADPGVVVH